MTAKKMLYVSDVPTVAPREVEVLEVDFILGMALVEHELPADSFLRKTPGVVRVRRRVPQTMLKHIS